MTLFLGSRLLSAAASAGLGIASFAIAGAANVGQYSAIAAGFAFAGGMGGGWLAQGILRFHQVSTTPTTDLFRWSPRRAQALTLATVVVGGLVGALVLGGSWPALLGTFTLAAIASASFALLSIQQARAMALHQGPIVILNEVSRASSLTAPPLLVSALFDTALPYAWSCLIVGIAIHTFALASGAAMRASARFGSQGFPTQASWPSPAAFFSYSAPLGFWIGLSAIYQNADRVMLAWLTTDAIAGEYALIYDISSRGLLLPVTALSGAASASILRMFNSGDVGAARSANRIIVQTQIALIAACGIAVMAGCLIAMRVLPWFEGEHSIVAMLTFLAAGVWTLADTIQRERLGQARTHPLVKWLAVVAVFGLAANLVVIPQFGIVGAALVTFASAVAYASCVIVTTPRPDLR